MTLINGDCNDHLKNYPDNYFDFGTFDPPYGIKEDGKKNASRGLKARTGNYVHHGWDNEPPAAETFLQIKRICKHWLIFGANYYAPLVDPYKTPRRDFYDQWLDEYPAAWVAWDKDNGLTDFNDFELALTSFDLMPTQRVKFRWQGMLQGDMKNKQIRIHATEKPIPLYAWIFRQFTQPGMRVIDSYMGSGASAVAAYFAGLDYTGIEKHPGIFTEAVIRTNKLITQTKLL
jgi:site-specific DNA-methyltransferase (adenine-specific)